MRSPLLVFFPSFPPAKKRYRYNNYLWDTISNGSQLLLLLFLLLLSGASNWCCNMATTSATSPRPPWPPSALPQSENVWHNLCRLGCCCCFLGLLLLLLLRLLQSHSFNKSVRVQDAGEFNEPANEHHRWLLCKNKKKPSTANKQKEKNLNIFCCLFGRICYKFCVSLFRLKSLLVLPGPLVGRPLCEITYWFLCDQQPNNHSDNNNNQNRRQQHEQPPYEQL